MVFGVEKWHTCAIHDTLNISQVPNQYRGMQLWNWASSSSKKRNPKTNQTKKPNPNQNKTKKQQNKGALEEVAEGTLGWQESSSRWGEGSCAGNENRVRVGWLVIDLSCVSLSWHYQKVSVIPVSTWHYLKMNCKKVILLKVAAFVLFETRNWLIGRNNFIALMYSASC